jgi:hypothetical protein
LCEFAFPPQPFYLYPMKKKASAILPAVHRIIPEGIEEIVRGASIFDRGDPDSVFNRSPPRIKAAIELLETSKSGMKWVLAGPKEIRQTLKPDVSLSRLRISFWEEYARAIDRDRLIREDFVYAQICVLEGFSEIIADPERFGYILNQPHNYKKATEELLSTGLDRLRDILELPLVNSKGQVQPAVIGGILKAVEMLDRRVKGAVMQKVAVHQHHTGGGVPVGFSHGADGQALAMEEIRMLESEIGEVRRKLDEKYAVLHNSAKGKDYVVDKDTTEVESE